MSERFMVTGHFLREIHVAWVGVGAGAKQGGGRKLWTIFLERLSGSMCAPKGARWLRGGGRYVRSFEWVCVGADGVLGVETVGSFSLNCQ